MSDLYLKHCPHCGQQMTYIDSGQVYDSPSFYARTECCTEIYEQGGTEEEAINKLREIWNARASNLVIEQLQQRNGELEKERDELAASVERLRLACRLGVDMFFANDIRVPNTVETMQDAIDSTPQANLNHVKREAIEEYKRSITEPNAIVHRYPIVDLSGFYLPGAHGKKAFMYGNIENAESGTPKAFVKCVIGGLLELLEELENANSSEIIYPIGKDGD